MENRPLLHVFTTSYQEQTTIMELITFYRERIPNCLITIYDNISTDNTGVIAKENNCEFILFDTGNKMDEKTLIELRNNEWKKSNAYYVIVADSDELVDITEKELIENLWLNSREDESFWTVSKCKGIELFGHTKSFKDATMGIYSEGYSKKVLFYKDAIKDSNFGPGSHGAEPSSNIGYQIVYNENPPNLYHTKWMDWENGLFRQNQIKQKGVSDDSKSKGWNFHYGLPESEHKKYFENGLANSIKVK